MMTPEISVIMWVCDESISQLERSVNSIIYQKYTNFEFIIVLDNPRNLDAKKYILEVAKNDKRIVFLENEKNIKSWLTLNRGVEKSIWTYIAIMDADDNCSQDKLLKQFNFLNNNPEVDILFTWWEEIDEKNNITIRIPSRIDFKNIKKSFFYKSPLLHASMMCERSILEKYKYSPAARFSDFELFLKLIAKWYRFEVIEENLYSYYINVHNQDEKFRKAKIASSNYIHILWKNISVFWNSIFFWWMFLLSIIQWILTRNKYVFIFAFNTLQKIYKKIFI